MLPAGRVTAPALRGLSRFAETGEIGTVKWFNSTKGFGFIQPDGGGKDVFAVHISAVEKAGLSPVNEGAKVSYELRDRGKEVYLEI